MAGKFSGIYKRSRSQTGHRPRCLRRHRDRPIRGTRSRSSRTNRINNCDPKSRLGQVPSHRSTNDPSTCNGHVISAIMLQLLLQFRFPLDQARLAFWLARYKITRRTYNKICSRPLSPPIFRSQSSQPTTIFIRAAPFLVLIEIGKARRLVRPGPRSEAGQHNIPRQRRAAATWSIL